MYNADIGSYRLEHKGKTLTIDNQIALKTLIWYCETVGVQPIIAHTKTTDTIRFIVEKIRYRFSFKDGDLITFDIRTPKDVSIDTKKLIFTSVKKGFTSKTYNADAKIHRTSRINSWGICSFICFMMSIMALWDSRIVKLALHSEYTTITYVAMMALLILKLLISALPAKEKEFNSKIHAYDSVLVLSLMTLICYIYSVVNAVSLFNIGNSLILSITIILSIYNIFEHI